MRVLDCRRAGTIALNKSLILTLTVENNVSKAREPEGNGVLKTQSGLGTLTIGLPSERFYQPSHLRDR